MLAPLLAGPLQGLFGRRTPMGRRRTGVLSRAVSCAALVALAVAVPFTSADPLRPGRRWVDRALSALPPGTKVLDDWDQGGYLMWRYPQLDLMMHGYGDTFTTDELSRNTGLIGLDPGWEDVAARVRGAGRRAAALVAAGLRAGAAGMARGAGVRRVRAARGARPVESDGPAVRRGSAQPAEASTQRVSTAGGGAAVDRLGRPQPGAAGRASSTDAAGAS